MLSEHEMSFTNQIQLYKWLCFDLGARRMVVKTIITGIIF